MAGSVASLAQLDSRACLYDEGRGKAIERGVGDWRGGRDHDYEKAAKGEVGIKRTDEIGMIAAPPVTF